MLQRIQSIWLLLASACAIVSFKVPFYSGTNKEGIPSFKLVPDADHFVLMLLTIVVAVLSLVSIFLYRNRTTQLRIVLLTMFVQIGLLAFYIKETMSFITGTYALTSILQVLILVFLFLAIRGINHDNKLIRDSDRLR
jgi:hypothetical protein